MHCYALALALMAVWGAECERLEKRCRRAESSVNAAPDAVRRAKAVVRLTLARERLISACEIAEDAVRLVAWVQSRVKGAV